MGTATLGLLKSEIILPVVPEYVPVVPLCPISRPSRPMIIGPELGPLRAAKLLLVCQVDLCWSFSELLIESFWGVPWILWPRKSQNSTIKMNMSQTILTSYFQNYTSKVKINVFGRINFFGYLGLLNWKILKRITVTFIKWKFFDILTYCVMMKIFDWMHLKILDETDVVTWFWYRLKFLSWKCKSLLPISGP